MLPEPFKRTLVLTGPTGSGKTDLGVELAEALDAEIVSMDSMALYRGMDIGTAKPSPGQCQRVRHHLIDVLDPWESASVAWWLEQAAQCCQEIESRGKRVLLVGGTPLYLKALMHGLFDGPPADGALRRQLADERLTGGADALHRRLASIDPVSAERLHPNDDRRVIRALEVFVLTGKPLSVWQTQWSGDETKTAPSAAESAQVLWLDVPREELYDRINRRVLKMFAAGFLQEVEALRQLPRPISREATQALGYKQALAACGKQVSEGELIAVVQRRSRNFAKRQITWFRHLANCRPATKELTWKLWKPTI
jgi:tRNA dimethylallyltransferase